MEIVLQSAWPSLFIGIAFLVIAAVYEWRTYRVPNILTFSAITTALIYWGVATWLAPERTGGLPGIMAGMIIGGGVLVSCYVSGFLGAGCVKAQAAFGAWVGTGLTLGATCQVVLVSSIVAAGSVYAYGLWMANQTNASETDSQHSASVGHGLRHGQVPISMATLIGIAVCYTVL